VTLSKAVTTLILNERPWLVEVIETAKLHELADRSFRRLMINPSDAIIAQQQLMIVHWSPSGC